MSPPPAPAVTLRHGTTLARARAIEANGPNPRFREPGSGQTPPAEGFSTSYTDGRPHTTGEATTYARGKAEKFPGEGGPAVLELIVPRWIVDVVVANGLGGGGEALFSAGGGLEELLAAWPEIPKQVIIL